MERQPFKDRMPMTSTKFDHEETASSTTAASQTKVMYVHVHILCLDTLYSGGLGLHGCNA